MQMDRSSGNRGGMLYCGGAKEHNPEFDIVPDTEADVCAAQAACIRLGSSGRKESAGEGGPH